MSTGAVPLCCTTARHSNIVFVSIHNIDTRCNIGYMYIRYMWLFSPNGIVDLGNMEVCIWKKCLHLKPSLLFIMINRNF